MIWRGSCCLYHRAIRFNGGGVRCGWALSMLRWPVVVPQRELVHVRVCVCVGFLCPVVG